MIPGPNLIQKCPYCGTEKTLMSLLSGNTFNGKVWSDCKEIYPMMPRVSTVQRCEKCGRYYFIDEGESHYADNDSRDYAGLGKLSYEEWKEAYEQKIHHEREKWDIDHKREVGMKLVQAYNDEYNREGVSTKTDPAEQAYIRGIIDEISVWFDEKNESDCLLLAEYMRETGRMEECKAYMSKLEGNEQMKPHLDKMLERANIGITTAFELQLNN